MSSECCLKSTDTTVVRLCPILSPLGCIHKIWNYEEWNLRPNFVIGFVNPIENTGILKN